MYFKKRYILCMDELLIQFKNRKLALLHDDLSANGNCLIVSPAKSITYDTLNELVQLSFGILKVALDGDTIEQLMLKPMLKSESAEELRSKTISNFISVDAREGITTGISIEDRLKAIQCLTANPPEPKSLISPGHIIPVQVTNGGLIVKNALTEGAFDLVKLSDSGKSAVFADVLDENGKHLSVSSRTEFAKMHNLPLINLSELTKELLKKSHLVECVAKAKLPSKLGGDMMAHMYKVHNQLGEHIALVKGKISPEKEVYVKVQVASAFEDIFGTEKYSSRNKIADCLSFMSDKDSAIFLYLRNEKNNQEHLDLAIDPKMNTYGMRNYGIGAQILRDLGARKLKLITRETSNLEGLQVFDLEIVETINLSALNNKDQNFQSEV